MYRFRRWLTGDNMRDLTARDKERYLESRTFIADITPECKCPTCKHLAFKRMFTLSDEDILEQTGIDVYSLSMHGRWSRANADIPPECPYDEGHLSFRWVSVDEALKHYGAIAKCQYCNEYMNRNEAKEWFRRNRRLRDNKTAIYYKNGVRNETEVYS